MKACEADKRIALGLDESGCLHVLLTNNLTFLDGFSLSFGEETSCSAVIDTANEGVAVELYFKIVKINILNFVGAEVSFKESAHFDHFPLGFFWDPIVFTKFILKE